MEINILEVFKSSITMMVLLGCSVLSIAFTFERLFFYRKIRINIEKFMSSIREFIRHNMYDDAIRLCEETNGHVSNIIKTGIENRNLPKSDIEELMYSARLEEKVKLERYLVIFGTMGNIGPLIGLFGTVIGIIKAFRDLAASGSGGPSVVAAGVALALVTTAGGLIVAIPAVVIYNYFMKKVKDMLVEMDVCARKLLVMLSIK
jgi:biopolymer transport protein ExbB